MQAAPAPAVRGGADRIALLMILLPSSDAPDPLACAHGVPGAHLGTDRLIGGDQPVGVDDRDDSPAGDLADEPHRPGLDGTHLGTRFGPDVDPAVARSVRAVRSLEGTDHGGGRADGPLPARSVGAGPGGSQEVGAQEDGEDERQHAQEQAPTLGRRLKRRRGCGAGAGGQLRPGRRRMREERAGRSGARGHERHPMPCSRRCRRGAKECG